MAEVQISEMNTIIGINSTSQSMWQKLKHSSPEM